MLNAEQCWAAVVAHDATQDGHFFYSVRTTGVYCRPGCASRQPRRENVHFYETPAAAEAAGFRPCKRCRPNEASSADRHVAAIGRAFPADSGRGPVGDFMGDFTSARTPS